MLLWSLRGKCYRRLHTVFYRARSRAPDNKSKRPVSAGIVHSRFWSSVYVNPSTAERYAGHVANRCPRCQTWCSFDSCSVRLNNDIINCIETKMGKKVPTTWKTCQMWDSEVGSIQFLIEPPRQCILEIVATRDAIRYAFVRVVFWRFVSAK